MQPTRDTLRAAYRHWDTVGFRLGASAALDPSRPGQPLADSRWPDWDARYSQMTEELAALCERVAVAEELTTAMLWAMCEGV